MSTDELTRSQHVDLPAEPVRFAERPLVRAAMLLVGLGVVVALPWLVYPPVAMDILAWGLFAISVDLLLGFTGLLSFGHAAFWGASAYATGLVAIHTGLPFPVAVAAGAVVAMLLAVPTGYLAVRRAGIYFAMVTLAFAQMLYFVANQWRAVTGGEDGLQGIPKSFFGLTGIETDPFYFYYAAAPIVLIGVAIAWRVVHSPFGRVLVAVRDNPARARALGYDVDRYKVMAFVVSAGVAGHGRWGVRRQPRVRVAPGAVVDDVRQGRADHRARRHRHLLGRPDRRRCRGAARGPDGVQRLQRRRHRHRHDLHAHRAALPARHLGHCA